MKYLMTLLLLPALLLCGFGPGDPAAGPGEEAGKDAPAEEKDAFEESDGMDTTDMMMKGYLDGQQEAMYLVQVHDDPQAGQYWQTEYKMAGVGTMTTRWHVARLDGETAIIEQLSMMVGDYSKYRYVIAYQLDLAKDASQGETNVTKAWIGKLGEEARRSA